VPAPSSPGATTATADTAATGDTARKVRYIYINMREVAIDSSCVDKFSLRATGDTARKVCVYIDASRQALIMSDTLFS
jgi:hypothetical protein